MLTEISSEMKTIKKDLKVCKEEIKNVKLDITEMKHDEFSVDSYTHKVFVIPTCKQSSS